MAKVRIVYEVDDQELKKVNKELDEVNKKNKETQENFKGTNEEVKKTKSSVVDLKGAVAQIGLAAAAGAAITEFAKLTQEVVKNRKEVALLTRETGIALDRITAKLRATASTFGKDFNEVLRAANVLSKEFGVSMASAIDTINEGFTRGLDVNGQYLDTLSEYSTFIKEAGINTKQFNSLIQAQVQQGVFSDKGIDAIKEAVISLREMTPATRDALKGIGINTDEMIKRIKDGTITYFEAVQEIAVKTRELADPVKTGTILADVFRGAGEDAGNFIFTLDQVGESMASASDEQEEYIRKQEKLLETSENVNAELVEFSTNFEHATTNVRILTNQIATASLQVLNSFLGVFVGINEEIDNFNKEIAQASLEDLEAELKRLEEGPTIWEQLGAGVFGPGALGEQAAEVATKIAILKDRIDELTIAEEEEAEAATKAEEATKRLAKAKEDQAEATKKAAEASFEQLKQEIADAELTEQLIDQELKEQQELSDELAKINQQRRDAELEAQKAHEKEIDEINEKAFNDWLEKEEGRRELLEEGLNQFADIYSQFTDLRIQQIDQELEANEFARNRELELAEGNVFRQIEINEKFNQRQDELRQEQKNKKKTAAIIDIGINTASAIIKGIAEFGPPPSPLGIAAIANATILGLAQSAAVAAFAEGVIDLQGPGTETSDSIPARLSRRESVMTAQETKDFKPTLLAIRNNEISPEILNNIALNRDIQPNITVNDYDKLAHAILNQPKKDVYLDEHGFTGYVTTETQRMIKRQAKFKM